MAYTQSQIESAEKIMKSAMSVDEISDYDALSQDDKDQYVSGFIENIKEWKKAYMQSNGQGGGAGQQQMPPDDGLRHWQPIQQDQQQQQQQQQEDQRKYIQDQSQLAKQAAQQSKDAGKQAQQSSQGNDAQEAADSAQEAAQAAQKAARQAQNAANAAAEASEKSNNPLAQQAADAAQDAANQAQEAADKAQQAADEAQEAADNGDTKVAQDAAQRAGQAAQQAGNKAQQAANATERAGAQSSSQSGSASQTAQTAAQQAADAAQRAQQAAANGDLEEAKAAAQEAADATQQAGQAAQQAGDSAKQEGQAAQQAGQNAENTANNSQNAQQVANAAEAAAKAAQQAAEAAAKADSEYHQTSTEHSKRNINPSLSEAQHSSSFGGKVSKQVSFSGNDVLDSTDYERAKEIAERAGQPVDSDDYDSPEKTAAKKYAEAKRELSKWTGDQQRGFGNSPIDLTETIAKLFASTIDWTDQLANFMTDKANIGTEDVMTKRYMGLDPTHPKYSSRYLHPKQIKFEKRSGIAEVFFLVDASGSMSFTCGDGENVYQHIMSELIQLEMDCRINKSAFAAFNTGSIEEDDVIVWTRRDAPNEDEIQEKLPLPTANGGTSALDAVESINKLDDIYNPDKTLLIIVTDGYDDYSQIKKVMTDDQLDNTVFLITRGSDTSLKECVNSLTSVGVEEDHVITVNVEKEWGASE